MALCLGRLAWTPDALWRATPREIAAAAAPVRPRVPAATRADLDRLIAAHPDPSPCQRP